jgi:hypothetical protein
VGTETTATDENPLNELNDYVDDLIKNAFQSDPVTIEDQSQETSETKPLKDEPE